MIKIIFESFKGFVWPYLNGGKLVFLKWVGLFPSHFFRKLVYRVFGMSIGKRAVIYGGAEIRRPEWIKIGCGSVVGNDAILDGRLGIEIGCNVNLSSGVWIWTVQHDHQSKDFKDVGGAVRIGDRAWISCRVVILPGVCVGEGAVVAAGAVVTKDVEPFSVVAGVPAKKIGDRRRDLDYSLADGSPIPFL